MEGIRYSTVSEIAGPLMIVEGVREVGYGEIVRIESNGEQRLGQVLEAAEGKAVIQVFEGTRGLDTKNTSVIFTGKPMEIGVSMEMLGRVFDGKGHPIDGSPSPIPETIRNVNGYPLNHSARDYPRDPIQPGISTITVIKT